MDPGQLLEVAAANLAGWHDCSIRALGLATTTGSWWWTSPTPGPWIYFTGVALRRAHGHADTAAAAAELRRHLDDPAGSYEAVCDSFGDLDLLPDGLVPRSAGLWYARPAGPLPGEERPAALTVRTVTTPDDLGAFEATTCAAFGAPPPVARFDIHAPGILEQPEMHVLLGEVDGQAVAGAMAYVSDETLGIYGVGTVPGHRGQGYATALTRACLELSPAMPAVLQPSPEASRLYRRLGFVEVGRFVHWG